MKYIEYESICNQIKQASESNQLIVFIGAGMSNNFGFPTWNGLVRKMYRELTGKEAAKSKAFSSDELLRIPQALRNKDTDGFEAIVKECFGAQRVTNSENAMLDEIMKLRPKHIITTNFDTLIEKYLQDKEEVFYKNHSAKEGYARLVNNHVPYHYMPVIKDGDMVYADANHLLLKIHGDAQNMDSLVLCEDDYLEYSDSHILMENFIKSLLINHTFLFIGYGVGDYNLKMIMKWVENIVSRQRVDDTKRKKHILLYAESKAMDELQRSYLEQKQIQVLEFCKLPPVRRKQPVAEFSDDRGKHLLAMLRALTASEKALKINDEKLQEVFDYFKNRKVIHTWEITSFFDRQRYEIRKADTELLLLKQTFGGRFMEAVIQAAGRRENTQLAAEARAFLGKAGIEKRRFHRDYEGCKVPHEYDDIMEIYCFTSDYGSLYKHAKNHKAYSFTEKAYWAMYVDNRKESAKWLEKQWNSKAKMDLYEQLRFAHIVQQDYELEQKFGVDFGRLWASMPTQERERQAVIREYAAGCAELYHEFGEVSDKLRLRCYAGKMTGGMYYGAEEFIICRTAVIDFVKTVILNGFYMAGLWTGRVDHGDISNLMRAYADMMLFLVSPECKRKPEWFQLCGWDIFILIHLVDKKELSAIIAKYKLVRIDAEDTVKETLVQNCLNMLHFSTSRISAKNENGHMCARRMENCMLLMNLFDWNKEQMMPLIEGIFVYLTKLMPLSRDERCFSASAYLFYEFLEKQNKKEYKEMISSHAEELLQRLIRAFLREDHLNHYSKVLEDNVEGYYDTAALSDLILKEGHGISKNLTDRWWKCYHKWYRGTASQFLADMYPFADGKVQKEISELANRKIKGMDIKRLRTFMERDIIGYSDAVEAALINHCRRFSNLTDRQKEAGGRDQSPLTHILRLWQNGKIPDIEVFREYKELDSWFSFVCFPEEFNYEEFDVEGWCTWLSNERYRGKAFQEKRELLRDKFRQTIEAGADEDVRRIYYKYLE